MTCLILMASVQIYHKAEYLLSTCLFHSAVSYMNTDARCNLLKVLVFRFIKYYTDMYVDMITYA